MEANEVMSIDGIAIEQENDVIVRSSFFDYVHLSMSEAKTINLIEDH